MIKRQGQDYGPESKSGWRIGVQEGRIVMDRYFASDPRLLTDHHALQHQRILMELEVPGDGTEFGVPEGEGGEVGV